MVDSYQAIFDAVRSRISGGDVGQAVRDVAFQQFDISYAMEFLKQEFASAAYEMQRAFVLLKPRMAKDGNAWICCYGDNIQEGVTGIGDSPASAARDFDTNWNKQEPK